jgi:hypothetical protein
VQLSIRQYAQHRGVSHAAVQKAIRQGRIQLTSDGKVDMEQADRDWTRNTGPSTPTRKLPEPGLSTRPSAGPSFAQSRAVRELYLARLAKLEYERQAGKLLQADAVNHALAIIMRDTRDHLLALPDRLAEAVAVEMNPLEVRNILSQEIRETLLQLSTAMRNRMAPGASAREADPSESSRLGNGGASDDEPGSRHARWSEVSARPASSGQQCTKTRPSGQSRDRLRD